MSKREVPHTQPRALAELQAQEAAERAEAAVALVAESAPTVLALGRHLAAVEAAYHLHDCASVAASQIGAKTWLSQGKMDILYQRAEAVRDLIATTPASCIGDAAVLVAEANVIAHQIAGLGLTSEEAALGSDKIARMLATALPWIARAAGLDLETMFWSDAAELGKRRYAGVAVQP